ncbi:MAG: hypothetical protein HY204_05925 [Nitrospirae bacterium]|nr:hypothetical protein [Nitrospirota bacterium]
MADTALAFMAIVTQTGDMTPRIAALNYLLAQQLPDGSWNDDAYSTALALQALAIGAPLQTPPPTLVSSVDLLSGSQSATTFGPQQTVTINVGLSGPPAQLEMLVLDPNGQVVFTNTGPGPFTFDTGTFPPGTYTVLIWVLDPTTGVPVSQSQTTFTILPGVAVAGGLLAVVPLSSHVGATENVTLAASLTNGSNVANSATVSYSFLSPSGAVLNSGSTPVAFGANGGSVGLTLANFSQTFSVAGVYPINVQVTNGSTVLITLAGSIEVAPLVRIDPTVTLTPQTVLPDGDKRIRIDIRLEGVEQKP